MTQCPSNLPTCSPTSVAPIPSALQQLPSSVSKVEGAFAELREKLDPLMSCVAEEMDPANTPIKSTCDVADTLNNNNRRLEELAEEIAAVTARVQL